MHSQLKQKLIYSGTGGRTIFLRDRLVSSRLVSYNNVRDRFKLKTGRSNEQVSQDWAILISLFSFK